MKPSCISYLFLSNAQATADMLNDVFVKRGHAQPVFEVVSFGGMFYVSEIQLEMPK